MPKLVLQMMLFTFPQQSIHNMNETDLKKTLHFLNIPSKNTKDEMINQIQTINHKQRELIGQHRIDIGGYYLSNYNTYKSFKLISIDPVETYHMINADKCFKITYDGRWRTFNENGHEILGYQNYDDFRNAILFIHQYKHVFKMTQYLIQHHILLPDIATHMINNYPKTFRII